MRHAFWLLLAGLSLVPQPAAGGAPGEVSFPGAGGLALKGTLVLPAGVGRAPAVLLLPGSGPTDRDGNQGPGFTNNLLRRIAEELLQAGIGSLRFDKRATRGYAAAWPRDVEGLSRFFSWQNFVEDAAAGLRFLQAPPGGAPARTTAGRHSG